MASRSQVGIRIAGFAILALVSLSLHGCGAGGGSSAGPSPSPSSGGGDYTGHGVSKSTYSCNDPISAWTFLNKYFPVETPTDECANNICSCPASGNSPAWEIQQGRVYVQRENSSGSGGHAGNGFGLHCVNVSEHLTTGGNSTSEVEAVFKNKLGDMSSYDAFMDYNVVFSTSGLANYKKAFQADGVKYLEGTWTSPDGTSYDSVIVQVAGAQMILELVQQSSLTEGEKTFKAVSLEQRVPTSALPSISASASESKGVRGVSSSSVGAYIVPLVVNRAASASAMAKLEDFYVSGMGTTKTHDETKDGVVKKCFLWTGATVHVCYTQRSDDATKGLWKVSDFETMLNTVHNNLMAGHPFCGMDKWEDNHYAIDSMTADTSTIINYINTQKPYHYCETSEAPSGSSVTLHYVWDPTGWGIQLDLKFTSVPDDCETTASKGRRLQSHTNPACTLDPQDCGSGMSPVSTVV